MKTIVHSPDAPAAIGPYSQAVSVRPQRLLFLSGQIALDREGKLVGGADVRAQTRQILDNLRAVLAADGMTFDHVVKTTIFLRDMADYAAVNEVYATAFSDRPPARAAVAVAGLPKDVDVEIECVAAAD